jgi:NRPS condensation-like uncharacterized protein
MGTLTLRSKTASTGEYTKNDELSHDEMDTNWTLMMRKDIATTATQITCSGNITSNSDERLKDNVVTIEDALQIVKNMRGVKFDMNGDRNVGLIAQEVQKVLPEVVIEADDDMKTLSVAYANIVGVLVEAIKELSREVDQLKSK